MDELTVIKMTLWLPAIEIFVGLGMVGALVVLHRRRQKVSFLIAAIMVALLPVLIGLVFAPFARQMNAIVSDIFASQLAHSGLIASGALIFFIVIAKVIFFFEDWHAGKRS